MMPNKNIKVNVLYFQNKGMQLLYTKYIPIFLTDQPTFRGKGGGAAFTTEIPKNTAEPTECT